MYLIVSHDYRLKESRVVASFRDKRAALNHLEDCLIRYISEREGWGNYKLEEIMVNSKLYSIETGCKRGLFVMRNARNCPDKFVIMEKVKLKGVLYNTDKYMKKINFAIVKSEARSAFRVIDDEFVYEPFEFHDIYKQVLSELSKSHVSVDD